MKLITWPETCSTYIQKVQLCVVAKILLSTSLQVFLMTYVELSGNSVHLRLGLEGEAAR